jgi:hypothetical protein
MAETYAVLLTVAAAGWAHRGFAHVGLKRVVALFGSAMLGYAAACFAAQSGANALSIFVAPFLVFTAGWLLFALAIPFVPWWGRATAWASGPVVASCALAFQVMYAP